MVKMRVLKEGGISGRKHAVGDEVEVKSSLAMALEQDGRAEFVDAKPAAKQRASRGSTAPRKRGRAA